MVTLTILLAMALPLTAAQVEYAREDGGWNCASHQGMSDELVREQYLPTGKTLSIAGYSIEVWKNKVPDGERRADRDLYVYIRHTADEDCFIRINADD